MFPIDRRETPAQHHRNHGSTMTTQNTPGILARLRTAITRPTPPTAAATTPAPTRPTPNPNTPAGQRGIPAASRTRQHIHTEPTITLPAPSSGSTAPAAAAGD